MVSFNTLTSSVLFAALFAGPILAQDPAPEDVVVEEEGGEGGEEQQEAPVDGEAEGTEDVDAEPTGDRSQECEQAFAEYEAYYRRSECEFNGQVRSGSKNTEVISTITSFCADGCLGGVPALLDTLSTACAGDTASEQTIDVLRKSLEIDMAVYCTETTAESSDERGANGGLCFIEQVLRAWDVHDATLAPADLDQSALCIKCIETQYSSFVSMRDEFSQILAERPESPEAGVVALTEERDGPWVDAMEEICGGEYVEDTEVAVAVQSEAEEGESDENDVEDPSTAASGAGKVVASFLGMVVIGMSVM